MNIYKVGWVGLAICSLWASTFTCEVMAVSEEVVLMETSDEQVLSEQSVAFETIDTEPDAERDSGVYLYAQATSKAQYTIKKYPPSNLTVVSLALDWIEVRSKTTITAWVPLDSVKIIDQKTVQTPSTPTAAYFRKPHPLETHRSKRLPLLLAPHSYYSAVRIGIAHVELEVSPRLNFWVKSQEYLAASQSENSQDTRRNVPLDIVSVDQQAEKDPLIQQDPYLDWLCSKPPTEKTLQLVSFRDPAEIAPYISNHPELDASQLVRAHSKDLSWHYLLYGNYPDQASAETAIEQLRLNRKTTSIRGIGYLQAKRCDI